MTHRHEIERLLDKVQFNADQLLMHDLHVAEREARIFPDGSVDVSVVSEVVESLSRLRDALAKFRKMV